MSDLVVYIPNHFYVNDDLVYVSWLDSTYYIAERKQHTFKLSSVNSSDPNFPIYVEYSEPITSGYVRQAVSGTTTITGLDHLEGRSVALVASGSYLGTFTVTNGSITSPITIYNYRVGLPFSMKCKTTRLELPQMNGTTQGRIKKINKLEFRYVKSINGRAGVEYDGVEYLDSLNMEFSANSQDKQILAKGGFNTDGYIVVRSNEPYPMTILSVTTNFDVVEG